MQRRAGPSRLAAIGLVVRLLFTDLRILLAIAIRLARQDGSAGDSDAPASAFRAPAWPACPSALYPPGRWSRRSRTQASSAAQRRSPGSRGPGAEAHLPFPALQCGLVRAPPPRAPARPPRRRVFFFLLHADRMSVPSDYQDRSLGVRRPQ